MTRREDEEKLRRKAQAILMMRRRDRTVRRGASGALGGASYHPKVQALVTYAQANAITIPNSARLTVLSNFISYLDTNGILALLDELKVYTYNDATLKEFSKINIITPGTANSVEVGANMTYGVNGWLGGTSSALSTGFIPATHGVNYTLNSAGFGCYIYNDAIQNTGAVMGGAGSAGVGSRSWIFPRLTANAFNVNVNTGTTMNVGTNTTSLGFHKANRTSSIAQNYYINGIIKQTQTTGATSGSLSDVAQYVCGYNNNGATVANTNQGVGMNYHGGNLTSKMVEFDAAWDAYLAAIFF